MNSIPLADLDKRISETRPFQLHGAPECRQNPITGHWTASDATRARRPHSRTSGDRLVTSAHECDFCLGRTIPAVLHSCGGRLEIPGVAGAIEGGQEWVHVNNEAFIGQRQFGPLLDVFREAFEPSAATARTFPNVCPLPRIGRIVVVNAFVTAAHPRYHDADLSECPTDAVAAHIDAWKLFHLYCLDRNNVLLPYINGGCDRRSGQSFAHPHSQHLILQEAPALFTAMGDARRAGRCRVCELLAMTDLHITPADRDLVVMANPAPVHSWGLYIVSRPCGDDFASVDSTAFAAAFGLAMKKLATLLGGTPAYNLVVRIGAGHFHAEVVPRSTNTMAGAEIGSQEFFNDVPASFVADTLRSV